MKIFFGMAEISSALIISAILFKIEHKISIFIVYELQGHRATFIIYLSAILIILFIFKCFYFSIILAVIIIILFTSIFHIFILIIIFIMRNISQLQLI